MLQPNLTLSPSTFSVASPNPLVITQSRDVTFSCDSSHLAPNELLRARELLRYYTPPSRTLTAGSPPFPSSLVEPPEPLAYLDHEPVLSPGPGDQPISKSSDDPTLMAFSQLLSVKLDCERSMVSLIDRTNQCVNLSPHRILMNIK
jgi:hypothetical protein